MIVGNSIHSLCLFFSPWSAITRLLPPSLGMVTSCQGSRSKQTAWIPWNTTKYLQPDWTLTKASPCEHTDVFSVCCFGSWQRRHSNRSVTSPPGGLIYVFLKKETPNRHIVRSFLIQRAAAGRISSSTPAHLKQCHGFFPYQTL